MGIARNEQSHWLTKNEKINGLTFKRLPLADSKGFILEIKVAPAAIADTLYWSFGDCKPETDVNVFVIEGQNFSCYYGGNTQLHLMQGITPSDDIKLSDGDKRQTPLLLYQAGKRTSHPLLVGRCVITTTAKLYFCFYQQNEKADYNYEMLPEVFAKNDKK